MRLFSKSFLILNLLLNAFAFSSTGHAQGIHQSDFHTPENFYWRRFEKENQLRFELWSFQGHPTEIYFVFEPTRLEIIDRHSRDSRFNLYIPSPYRTAYEAHPEFETSLEEEFVKTLEFLNIKDLPSALEVKSSDSKIFELRDEIEVPEFVVSDWISDLQMQILETENWALQSFGLSKHLPGRKFLSDFNPVEAVLSIEGNQETRLDAFVLSPLIALEQEGEKVLKALEDFASQSDMYVLEWFFRSTQYSQEVRLAVLMLITHNHVAEDWFIRACTVRWGIQTAWEAFQNLNKIYKNERYYWRYPERHRQKSTRTNLPSHVVSTGNIGEVNVSPKTRILSAMYGMPKLAEASDPEWLPYTQLYHYYGAFILAYILDERKKVPETFIDELVTSFGLTYKIKTAGFQRKQLEKISSFYGTGATHYLFLRDFIR